MALGRHQYLLPLQLVQHIMISLDQLQPSFCLGAGLHVQFLGHGQELVKVNTAQGLAIHPHIMEHFLKRSQ